MPSLRLAAALTFGVFVATPDTPLRVLRAHPVGDATPTTAVTVTFDRPVASALDSTVDARALFRIEPVVEGRVEWRDPVTIRFTPARPLAPNTSYTVTIANTFQALDGSRLEAPYTFAFQVRGPRVFTGSAANRPRFLTPGARFEIVTGGPVDLAFLSRWTYIALDRSCGGRVIRLDAVGQRPLREDDPTTYRYAGEYGRGRSVTDHHQVVRLVPREPLPRACAGALQVPSPVDTMGLRTPMRWSFSTYGDFQLARAVCGGEGWERCPTGPIVVRFTTPVRGAEVLRHVKILPAARFTIADTAGESDRWMLDGELKARTTYGVVVDTLLKDVFGQRLTGNPVATLATTGYSPSINYISGRVTVERDGPRTIAVEHVNVDTLEVLVAAVPESLEFQFLRGGWWSWRDLWEPLRATAERRLVPAAGEPDRPKVTVVKLPAFNAARRGTPTLVVLQVRNAADHTDARLRRPLTVAQVTDLGVHARIGTEEGAVWVTGVKDGLPRAGATATLYDRRGTVRATARTDSLGLARFTGLRPDSTVRRDEDDEWGWDYGMPEGYVGVTLGSDRAVVSVAVEDPDLSPWQFNVPAAWGRDRRPGTGAVFTERGIYRPGEPVYAKAIVRNGPLGALTAPARGDSVRWLFTDREGSKLRDTVIALSSFGTADHTLTLPRDAPLGWYGLAIHIRRQGRWAEQASTSFRVAEYRPPEFAVDAFGDTMPRFAGDSFRVNLEARYLFGAPMARATVNWTARQRAISTWEIDIPGTEGYYVGETGWWWEDFTATEQVQVLQSGTDTLDAAGRLVLRIPLKAPDKNRPARATVEATVVDVNRQTVSASASAVVHPAAFYIAAKPEGSDYFWRTGAPRTITLVAVTPAGRRLPGIALQGVLIRREWHRVLRGRGGVDEEVGEWVADTVGRCAATSAAQPVACQLTPTGGGSYTVLFRAKDAAGRAVTTSFYRWATGRDWVPWNDEGKFKMDVVPDRTRYTVGDTATVLFASPFTDAEAWVTVEREGVIEQRRLRLTSGATTLKFAITESYAPNAFVSIVVARGRSAPPRGLDDPGRPTLRVGYAELRVTPEVKRLAVAVEPAQNEYQPGDSARIGLRVRDARGRGQRSEVTLWAVDEGVLSLTGYRTPDPIDLIYRPRGLGLRLASNLAAVAPQVPEGEKGQRAPGGGGGLDVDAILRSRFQTTAFFLGSVVTDADGRATAVAKLPDNLTTFRVMAVAVTAGDRYGSGESKLLVTRPLLARPALPRFLREGDRFRAGVVVNHRLGGTPTATVTATGRGVTLSGAGTQSATLAAGRGVESRFDFQGVPGDSATFRFVVQAGQEADAVQLAIPVRPAYHPRAFTVAGVLYDTATAEFALPGGIDPGRSRLDLSFGTSPLTILRGGHRWYLRVYPYYCSEQVTSAARPLIALYRAQQLLGVKDLAPADAEEEIREAVDVLSRRQRADGGIGYWNSGGPSGWTSPWLSSYAGMALLEARQAGIPVSDTVLSRLAGYLTDKLRNPSVIHAPVIWWYEIATAQLTDQVAAAEFLRRLGRPDVAAENRLATLANKLAWEDRAKLAELLALRGDRGDARRLLESLWSAVRVEGRRAVVPAESKSDFYFRSTVRPTARLLTATLAVDSAHALVGPLIETLVQQGRAGVLSPWNTQDYGSAVSALSAFEQLRRASAGRLVRVRAGGRMVAQLGGQGALVSDSSTALTGLLADRPDGSKGLRLLLDAPGTGGAVFYYLTVREVPTAPQVTPEEHGIQVERWYERLESRQPVTGVAEGDLVRVRLRIRVTAERQFVVLDDALPAGLEAVDLSLRTAGGVPGAAEGPEQVEGEEEEREASPYGWYYGAWDYGWWTPFDYRELRDDRVVYFASYLWKGTYTATYVARATTPGVFVRPPAHAEEMYNPAVYGRSDGGTFSVTARNP